MAVVREVDGLGEPASQPGVRVDEDLHLIGIAGGDHHDAVAPILDQLDEGVDGLLAEVLLASPGQGVGLVDEQHTLVGLVEHLGDLQRGLPHEPRHHPRPVRLHQVAALDHPKGAVDLGQQTGHGGLARARVPGEHQVAAGVEHRQAPLNAQLLHLQQVGDQLDLGLHSRQPDQRVEFGEQFLERAGWCQLLGFGRLGAAAGVPTLLAGPPVGHGGLVHDARSAAPPATACGTIRSPRARARR